MVERLFYTQLVGGSNPSPCIQPEPQDFGALPDFMLQRGKGVVPSSRSAVMRWEAFRGIRNSRAWRFAVPCSIQRRGELFHHVPHEDGWYGIPDLLVCLGLCTDKNEIIGE